MESFFEKVFQTLQAFQRIDFQTSNTLASLLPLETVIYNSIENPYARSCDWPRGIVLHQ